MSTQCCLMGAIVGDIMGSIYEFGETKDYNFAMPVSSMDFTDDTIMTCAVADWLISSPEYKEKTLVECMQRKGEEFKFPLGGYGSNFARWLESETPHPYNSWGNGSAMRVSPVGFAFDTLEKTLEIAERSAAVTHNHTEGIKGAQATAAAIFLARTGSSKEEIKNYIEQKFHYNLHRTLDEIRPTYKFDESCQGSVPESIIAFLEGNSYEDAIRKAISLGGDSDTMGAICGAIAFAYYKEIPQELYNFAFAKLPYSLKNSVLSFEKKFIL